MIVRSFVVPKLGCRLDECQDAFAVSRRRRRFAVADGMTDSAMSGEWAQLLASQLVTSAEWDRQSLRRASVDLVGVWSELTPPEDELPWYLATKLAERGAHATVAALDLDPVMRGRRRKAYRMLAIGDACVFHLREDRILRAHPFSEPDDFPSRPFGLGTVTADDNALGVAGARFRTGTWRHRDRFLLMSDALALYFLKAVKTGSRCARDALPFQRTQRSFEAWVEGLRRTRSVKDDDTTLLEIIT